MIEIGEVESPSFKEEEVIRRKLDSKQERTRKILFTLEGLGMKNEERRSLKLRS